MLKALVRGQGWLSLQNVNYLEEFGSKEKNWELWLAQVCTQPNQAGMSQQSCCDLNGPLAQQKLSVCVAIEFAFLWLLTEIFQWTCLSAAWKQGPLANHEMVFVLLVGAVVLPAAQSIHWYAEGRNGRNWKEQV